MKKNLVQRLAIDSGSNIAVNLINNVLSLVTLPLYLHLYGDVLWGIYIWAISVSGLLLSFDFGVRAGLRRFVARYTANGNKQEVEIGLSLTTLIIGALALINCSIIIILSFYPETVLNLSTEYSTIAGHILLIAAIYSLFFWGTQISSAILEGFQLYVNKNINLMISVFFYVCMYVYVRYHKIDFLIFVALMFFIRALPFVLNVFVIYWKQLLKGIRLRVKVKKSDFKSDFFKFSSDVFLLAILNLFVFKLDKFIIGGIIGAGFITKYVVVTKPMFIVRTIDSFIFSAVQPMIAREHSRNNSMFLRKVLLKGSLFNFLIIIPLCILVVLILKPFLHVWIGNQYDEYIFWGQLGIATFIFKPFYSAAIKVLLNMGKTSTLKKIKIITVAINFTISVIATFFLGIGGVIMGSFIEGIVRVPLYLSSTKKELGIGLKEVLPKEVVINFLFCFLTGGFLFWLIPQINMDSGWLAFIFWSSIFGFILFFYSFFILLYQENIWKKIFKRNKAV